MSAPPPAPIECPACGRENAPDAVFCRNNACHKALGEFEYVQEVLRMEARWFETLAEKITEFIGRTHFLAAHTLWFVLWVGINTGILMVGRVFDAYPFGLLGIILAVEAIFITGFLLISSNRQSTHADKRAELDYKVNVETFRKINEIDHTLDTILAKRERLEAAGRADARREP